MEKFHYKPESITLTSQETQFISDQAQYLRKLLKSLNLDSIPVNDEIELRNADFFAHHRTLAYTGISDIPLAILASSGSKKIDLSLQPVSTILVAPTMEGSGILVDDKTNTIWTDSFWICEDGIFKYIKPSQPIPIDGLNVVFGFDQEQDDPVLNNFTKTSKELEFLAEDKKRTKEILADAGIPVPNGIFLASDENNISEKIDEFLSTYPNMKGIVLKGIYGARGEHVILFDIDEIDYVKEWAHRMLEEESSLIVEERIIPPPEPKLQHEEFEIFEIDTDKEIDYNFRVLVTLNSSDAEIIDSEIRFSEKSNNPVNISQGAKAARINRYSNSDALNRVHKVAKEATQILCQQIIKDGETAPPAFAGIDVMLDQEENAVVIEANFGPVGGFATLVRLDKQPPDSIKDILIPASLNYLEEMFAKRVLVESTNLRRLSYNKCDQEYLFHTYMENDEDLKRIQIDSATIQEREPKLNWPRRFQFEKNFNNPLQREMLIPKEFVLDVSV